MSCTGIALPGVRCPRGTTELTEGVLLSGRSFLLPLMLRSYKPTPVSLGIADMESNSIQPTAHGRHLSTHHASRVPHPFLASGGPSLGGTRCHRRHPSATELWRKPPATHGCLVSALMVPQGPHASLD